MARRLTKAHLREAQLGIRRAYVHRDNIIRRARQEGWEDREIAEAAGLTRMAVWKIRQRTTTKET